MSSICKAHANAWASKASDDKICVSCSPCKGFWLGASPDGWVTDPSESNVHGILELKYPYSKADVSPEKACEDDIFYCSMVNSKLNLKRNHASYHQVQLQLYVAADLCDWCDFYVYVHYLWCGSRTNLS